MYVVSMSQHQSYTDKFLNITLFVNTEMQILGVILFIDSDSLLGGLRCVKSHTIKCRIVEKAQIHSSI